MNASVLPCRRRLPFVIGEMIDSLREYNCVEGHTELKRFGGLLSLSLDGRLLLCAPKAPPAFFLLGYYFPDRRLGRSAPKLDPRAPITTLRPPSGDLPEIGVLTASVGRGASFIFEYESLVAKVLNWKVLCIEFSFHFKDVHGHARDWACGCLLGWK
jgi:hypothetical protein